MNLQILNFSLLQFSDRKHNNICQQPSLTKMGLLGLLGFLLNEMDFAGFFGFDDIAGFEKMVILRFLIFGFVFLDLSLSSCLRHILISIYVVFSF